MVIVPPPKKKDQVQFATFSGGNDCSIFFGECRAIALGLGDVG